MTEPRPDRDDDGSVDVEAAWADIVAHWHDGETTDRTSPTVLPPDAPRHRDPTSGRPASDAVKRADTEHDERDDERDGERADATDDAGDEWADVRSHVGGEAAREAGLRDDATEADGAAPDEERFVPPEPPPLPRGDAVSRLAWVGVLGAPLFFVVAALFWRSAPTLLIVVAVVAFVAGFATLVVRMPDRRDGDDDDGARV